MKQKEKFIDINGNQVMDLTPDYNRPLALVDLQVLNMLTDLLGKESFPNIRHELRAKVMKTTNLEELVQVTENFTAFHQSVNLIREVTSNEIPEVDMEADVSEPKVVGKIDLDGDMISPIA